MTDSPRVWCCFPTANPKRCRETFRKWSDRGYFCIAYIDDGERQAEFHPDYPCLGDEMRGLILAPDKGMTYPGYYMACNLLIGWMYHANIYRYEKPDCVVCIGDDMDPDPSMTAQQIAAQMLYHFGDRPGVMQPCGDPQGETIGGLHNAARICGSPWVNRAWIEGGVDGYDPLPTHGFIHFFGDELLKLYAENLGCLWMRPDITQFHRHWSFGHGSIDDYQRQNQAHWNHDRYLFAAACRQHGLEQK